MVGLEDYHKIHQNKIINNVSQGIFWQPQVGARIMWRGTMFLDTAQKKRWSSMKKLWHHDQKVVPPSRKRGPTIVAFSKG